jgi:hypothetical protein
MCITLDLDVIRTGERSNTIGRRSRLLALVKAFMPGMSPQEQTQLVVDILGSEDAPERCPDKLTKKALDQLDPEEQQGNFKSLREGLQDKEIKEYVAKAVQRTAADKKVASNTTPDSIKGLRPPEAPTRCMLVWDVGLGSFEGYYPLGKPRASTSSKWGGSTSQLAALHHCVNYVWKQHADKGFD